MADRSTRATGLIEGWLEGNRVDLLSIQQNFQPLADECGRKPEIKPDAVITRGMAGAGLGGENQTGRRLSDNRFTRPRLDQPARTPFHERHTIRVEPGSPLDRLRCAAVGDTRSPHHADGRGPKLGAEALRFQPKAPLVERLEFARAELAFVEPGPLLGRKALPKHAVCLMRVGDLDLEKISWHVGPSPYPFRPGCNRNIPLRVPRAKMHYTPCGCSVHPPLSGQASAISRGSRGSRCCLTRGGGKVPVCLSPSITTSPLTTVAVMPSAGSLMCLAPVGKSCTTSSGKGAPCRDRIRRAAGC